MTFFESLVDFGHIFAQNSVETRQVSHKPQDYEFMRFDLLGQRSPLIYDSLDELVNISWLNLVLCYVLVQRKESWIGYPGARAAQLNFP